MNISAFVRNMIKRGIVSFAPVDTGQFATSQVKWSSEKVGNVQVIHPYGFYSNAPIGSLALMLNVMGQEENRAAFIDNPKTRFKNLKSSEVAVGNPVTLSVVKFLENGDIEITGTADQNIIITGDSNLTVSGNTTITTSGNTIINTTGNIEATVGGTLEATIAGNTSITSPIVDITGQLRVSGEITAFYTLGNEISFTDIKTIYNTHTHDENDAAPAPTDVPNQLLP